MKLPIIRKNKKFKKSKFIKPLNISNYSNELKENK